MLEGNFSNYAQRNLETSHMARGIFQGKEFNMILTSHHLGALQPVVEATVSCH